jgi:uncharacterized membrane protein
LIKGIKRLIWVLLILDAVISLGSCVLLALPSKTEDYAGAGLFVIMLGTSCIALGLGFILLVLWIYGRRQVPDSGKPVKE